MGDDQGMDGIVRERAIRLDGCVNFRDLGGYRTGSGDAVRWRRLFRSDDLDELSPHDVDVLRAGLGVRTVVDLRGAHELRTDAVHPLGGARVELVTAPFMVDGAPEEPPNGALGLSRRYLFLLEHAGAAVRTVFAAIADCPGGVVVHCAAGKDRTGLAVAAVLGSIGVVDDDIAADYALTKPNLDRIGERLRRMPAYDSWYRHVPRSNGEAHHATMVELLAIVRDRYGSMEGLVRHLGVEPATVGRVRAALLGRLR